MSHCHPEPRGENDGQHTHEQSEFPHNRVRRARAHTHPRSHAFTLARAHTHSHWRTHALTRTHPHTPYTDARVHTQAHKHARSHTATRAHTVTHTHTLRSGGAGPRAPRAPSLTFPYRSMAAAAPSPSRVPATEARSPLEAQTHAQHKDEVGEDGGGRGGRGRRLTRTEARSREARAVQAPGREPLPGPRPGAPSGWPLPAPARARAGMFTQSWSYNGSTRIAGTRAGSGGQSGPSSRAVTPPTAHRFHSSAVTFPPGWLTCVAAHVPCTAYRKVCHIPRGPKGLLLEAGGKG